MNEEDNKITGANAGGPRRSAIRTPWAARIAEFCRCPANMIFMSNANPDIKQNMRSVRGISTERQQASARCVAHGVGPSHTPRVAIEILISGQK